MRGGQSRHAVPRFRARGACGGRGGVRRTRAGRGRVRRTGRGPALRGWGGAEGGFEDDGETDGVRRRARTGARSRSAGHRVRDGVPVGRRTRSPVVLGSGSGQSRRAGYGGAGPGRSRGGGPESGAYAAVTCRPGAGAAARGGRGSASGADRSIPVRLRLGARCPGPGAEARWGSGGGSPRYAGAQPRTWSLTSSAIAGSRRRKAATMSACSSAYACWRVPSQRIASDV